MNDDLQYSVSNYSYQKESITQSFELLLDNKKDELFFHLFNSMSDNTTFLSNYKNFVKFLEACPEPKEKAIKFLFEELTPGFFKNPLLPEQILSEEEKITFKNFWAFDYSPEVPRIAIILSQLSEKNVIAILKSLDNNLWENPINSFFNYHDDYFKSDDHIIKFTNQHPQDSEQDVIVKEFKPSLSQHFFLHLLQNNKLDILKSYIPISQHSYQSFDNYSEYPVFSIYESFGKHFGQYSQNLKTLLFFLSTKEPSFIPLILNKEYSDPINCFQSWISQLTVMSEEFQSIHYTTEFFSNISQHCNHFINTVVKESLIKENPNYSDEELDEKLESTKEQFLIHFLTSKQEYTKNVAFAKNLNISLKKFFKHFPDNLSASEVLFGDTLLNSLPHNYNLLFSMNSDQSQLYQEYSIFNSFQKAHEKINKTIIENYEKLPDSEKYQLQYPRTESLNVDTLESKYGLSKDKVLEQFLSKPFQSAFKDYKNNAQLITLSQADTSLTTINESLFSNSFPDFYQYTIKCFLKNDDFNDLIKFQNSFDDIFLGNTTTVEKTKMVEFLNKYSTEYDKSDSITTLSYLTVVNPDRIYSTLFQPHIKNYLEKLNSFNFNTLSESEQQIITKHKSTILTFFKESFLNHNIIMYNYYSSQNIEKFVNIQTLSFNYLLKNNMLTDTEKKDLTSFIDQSPIIDLYYSKAQSKYCNNYYKERIDEVTEPLTPLIQQIEKFIMDNTITSSLKKTKQLKF